MSKAINDVIAERLRQQTVEGWSSTHDAEHPPGHLARAAACYADPRITFFTVDGYFVWPFDTSWWKPSDTRRNLVKAGALILAEIDRFDGLQGEKTDSAEGVFDLVAHLYRQREFSQRTFGPGKRVHGVTDHIAKELIEVRESDGDLKEWVDVIILGLDGAWRSGATPEQIVEAIVAKQSKNEGRKWPDWRTAEPGKAIEHVREEKAT